MAMTRKADFTLRLTGSIFQIQKVLAPKNLVVKVGL